jgi:DNA-nicking Smr family endonuclease
MSTRTTRGRRRAVSEAEQALWARAVRDVRPLGGTDEEAAATAPVPSFTEEPAPVGPPAQPAEARPRRAPLASPPLTGLDRRTRQRLSRGQAECEARLDLHGLGLEAARLALARFLRESATRGRRLVLVITGKGESPIARHTLHGMTHFDAPEREGRLRRKLPQWLAEDDLRGFVTGYQPAHPRHGGGGAFYVRLRRRERMGQQP